MAHFLQGVSLVTCERAKQLPDPLAQYSAWTRYSTMKPPTDGNVEMVVTLMYSMGLEEQPSRIRCPNWGKKGGEETQFLK